MIQRVYELERRLNSLEYALRRLEQKEIEDAQSLNKAWIQHGGGGDGLPPNVFWTKTPHTGSAAASGTWPSLVATTFTADVYRDEAGTWVKVATGATIKWRYLDAWAIDRLVPCLRNVDGTTYDALADSCVPVA